MNLPKHPRPRPLAPFVLAAALLAGHAARAGPPFVTDDPEPVDLGHWEVYAFSDGAVGRGDASGVGPSIEVNYGAAPNLQLHLIGNLAYDDPAGGPAVMGPGDTELGIAHRYEEFDDNHSSVDYRMDESLPHLARALAG